jgi:hypothetical protein
MVAAAEAEMDDDGTTPLEAVDTGRTKSLDSVDTGRTESLDEVEARSGAWEPPECGSIEVALGPLPEGADPDAWSDRLLEARQAIKTSKFELERADSAYAQARNLRNAVGAPAARLIAARDEARTKYSQSLCALPELVEHALRAGVTPGVLRRYDESPANSD